MCPIRFARFAAPAVRLFPNEVCAVEMTVNDLHEMTRDRLDALFKSSAAGPIPVGDTKGAAVFLPGTI